MYATVFGMYMSMVCPWVCVCAHGVCACVQLCAFELIFASVCEYTSILEWWPYYVFDMWILFQRWMSMIMAFASRTIVFLTYAFVPPHTHHTHMRTHTRTHVIHHTYTHNTRMLHMHTHTHTQQNEWRMNKQPTQSSHLFAASIKLVSPTIITEHCTVYTKWWCSHELFSEFLCTFLSVVKGVLSSSTSLRVGNNSNSGEPTTDSAKNWVWQWCHLVVTAVVTGSSSPFMRRHM